LAESNTQRLQIQLADCNTIVLLRPMKYTFTPEPLIAEQLQELARITQRPVSDLINDLLSSPLNQMIGDRDTDFMRLVLDDVEYPDHATAEAIAEAYNAINRTTVMKSKGGQFHVSVARAGDDCVVHFSRSKLVKASDFSPATN
jgi:DNA-binding protein Fis